MVCKEYELIDEESIDIETNSARAYIYLTFSLINAIMTVIGICIVFIKHKNVKKPRLLILIWTLLLILMVLNMADVICQAIKDGMIFGNSKSFKHYERGYWNWQLVFAYVFLA